MTRSKRRRPDVEDYDSYEEFYKAVYNYVKARDEDAGYDPGLHIEKDNELVRECPHCGAPAIISIMSPPSSPSWRCVGEYQLSDRHQFTKENIPDDRLEGESNVLLKELDELEEEVKEMAS